MPLPSYILWPLSIVLAIVIFSLAVFIHELGHFLVARLLGLKADVFSIGFGPALWKRDVGGTEIRFSAIPFGGYVSLPQLDPEGMKKIQGDHSDGSEEIIPPAAPWKRILVALAGPFGNVVLAILCAMLICYGAPDGATGGSTELGIVYPQSSAANAGLQAGDRILSVNGTAVRSWSDVQTESFLSGTKDTTVTVGYERAGKRLETTAVLDTQLQPGEPYYIIGGMMPGPISVGIGDVVPDSPAARAGLKRGDILKTVDGEPFVMMEQLTQRKDAQKPVKLTIVSDGESREVTLVPETLKLSDITPASDNEAKAIVAQAGRPRIGVVLAYFGQRQLQWMTERGVMAQLKADANGVLRIFKALMAPKTKGEAGRAASGLGGPLMIFGVLIHVVQTGLWVSLGFLRLICVNLAILNLLPLPVLDGGHVIFALYAMIFRREISPRVLGVLSNVFAIALIGLMVWFLYQDSARLLRGLF